MTVNSQDKLVYISYYDKDGKKRKVIDLTTEHAGIKPHVHHGYIHNELDGPKKATKLEPDEKKLVDTVRKLWYNHKSSKR